MPMNWSFAPLPGTMGLTGRMKGTQPVSALRGGRQAREVDDQTLRTTAVVVVVTGVVLLAYISFRFSYAGIHSIAVAAGVSPGEARLYPLILDGMLVVACVAALALHRGRWWMRGYAWLLVLALLAAMAVLDAWHAAGVGLPHRLAAAMMAVLPWLLLLLGLGLFLVVLRDLRDVRARGAAGGRVPQRRPPAADPTPQREAAGRDRPDASVLLPGLAPPEPPPEPVRPGLAEFDDPEEPAVRLLPPGPKPGGAPAAPGD
jgi:uncharacterized protein DUF2637